MNLLNNKEIRFRPGPASVDRSHGHYSYAPLLGILIIAFALRLWCVIFLTGTIDTEGAEYARIAENLFGGRGYTGISAPGKDLMFPPLFPVLIGAVRMITGQVELAGRVVSLLMGTLLVLPVYLIGQHLYGRRVGLLAAALAACHPLMVNFSAAVYCEMTYLALLLMALYGSFRSLRLQSSRSFVFTGVCFGLAYLTRPEAIVCLFAASLLSLVYFWKTEPRRLQSLGARLLWMPIVFTALAGPYIVWLHAQTGQWRLEGKSPLNYLTISRLLEGANLHEVACRVDDDLNERGIWNQAAVVTVRSARFEPREVGRYILARSKEAFQYPKDQLTGSLVFGSPPLFALAMVGLFRRRWDGEAAANQLVLLAVLGASCGALLWIHYFSIRFLLVFLPILLVWASNGIFGVAEWARQTLRLPRVCGALNLRWTDLLAGGFATVIPLFSLTAVGNVNELRAFNAESRPLQNAGEWLGGYVPGPKKIMDTATTIAFHAGAQYMPLPYCASAVALRYFDKKNVDFIVLRNLDASSRPYLKDWIARGIPSARATLIKTVETPVNGRIQIYRWSRPGEDEAGKSSAAGAGL